MSKARTTKKKSAAAARKRTTPAKRQNVFAELGFGKAESAELLRKADLQAHIVGIYQDRGYTQAEFGKILGQKQPHISRLLGGKLEDISIDKLISYLEQLGADVEVKIIVKRGA